MLSHRANHVQQLFAANQFNRLAFGKLLGVFRVAADADDLHRVCLVMTEQAIHFSHDADADLLTLPLFTLHQRAAAILAQDQVDAAVWAAQAGFFDVVALAAEGVGDQLFELAPAAGSEAFQAAAGVEEAAASARAEVGDQRGEPANAEQHPGQRGEECVRLLGEALRE
ncbi:hypothetical protein GW15_0221040 [Xanthomonas axonopodis pv. vasculorum]|uniref:Uncharacterized protein n=1 Tax=Xanthomonas axonopodis pv. vasculorum TaxID=325777 RepID=A0A098PXK3_9XANT|nr:hypothetical protein GW15_0221040 [Xanthomonas axonopodis pv. vasculorum]